MGADRAKPRKSFSAHRPMRESLTRVQALYQEALDRLIQALGHGDYSHVVVAAAQRAMRDPGALDELRASITQMHAEFARRPEVLEAFEEAYLYGRAIGADHEVRAVAHAHFVTAHKPAAKLKLSRAEELSARWARESAAQHITGLGNRVASDFTTEVIEADRKQRLKYQEVIREEVAESIERREDWRKLASRLGHKTKDWARDFKRIAATEKQNAMMEGLAASIHEEHGAGALIAKIPASDACADCQRLYLDHSGQPRIFTLVELGENGSNVGLRKEAWKATLGTIHPWCQCAPVSVPRGWRFNEKGDLVPGKLSRSCLSDPDSLMKSIIDPPKHLTYKYAVPDHGVVVRVGDPMVRAEIEKVIAATPPQVFDKVVGVTLITTDMPRAQNPLDEDDLAYWTRNEIRLSQTLPPDKVQRVLTHEIGHSLNVYLMHRLGGLDAVRAWHRDLWKISKEEGFVSEYAKKLPIENAAEVVRELLYDRQRLMLDFPRQFAFAYRYLGKILQRVVRSARLVPA